MNNVQTQTYFPWQLPQEHVNTRTFYFLTKYQETRAQMRLCAFCWRKYRNREEALARSYLKLASDWRHFSLHYLKMLNKHREL